MTSSAPDLPPPPVLGLLFRPVAAGPFSAGRRLAAFAAGATVLVGVAALDWRLSPAVRLGPVYLLPIVLAAWFGGRWPGYLTAVAASVVWAAIPRTAALQQSGTAAVVVGSLLPRLVMYPAVVELLTLLQEAERRLRRAVEVRTAELRREVAERRRAEASLRHLAAQLSAAEDAERRRVAHDLHDAVSQMLGVVKLNLQTVVAAAPAGCAADERLIDVIGVVDEPDRADPGPDLRLAPVDAGPLRAGRRRWPSSPAQFGRRTGTDVTVTEVGRPPVPAAPAGRRQLPVPGHQGGLLTTPSGTAAHGRLVVAVHWPDGRGRRRCGSWSTTTAGGSTRPRRWPPRPAAGWAWPASPSGWPGWAAGWGWRASPGGGPGRSWTCRWGRRPRAREGPWTVPR